MEASFGAWSRLSVFILARLRSSKHQLRALPGFVFLHVYFRQRTFLLHCEIEVLADSGDTSASCRGVGMHFLCVQQY